MTDIYSATPLFPFHPSLTMLWNPVTDHTSYIIDLMTKPWPYPFMNKVESGKVVRVQIILDVDYHYHYIIRSPCFPSTPAQELYHVNYRLNKFFLIVLGQSSELSTQLSATRSYPTTTTSFHYAPKLSKITLERLLHVLSMIYSWPNTACGGLCQKDRREIQVVLYTLS